MRSIEELRLESSGLTSLPEAIGDLAPTTLPASMRNLKRLIHLDLRGNHFASLPEWLPELNLPELDLREALRGRGCRVLF